MWRALASNFLTVAVVVLVAVAGAIAWGERQWAGPGPLADAICVEVPPESTMRDLSEALVAQDAVSSGAVFRVGVDYAARDAVLKAGTFRLPERASMSEIVGIVTGDGRSTCGTEVVQRVGAGRTTMVVRAFDPASNGFAEEVVFDPAEGEAPEAYDAALRDPGTRFRVVMSEGATSWQVARALEEADFLTGAVGAVPAEGSLAPGSYEVEPGEARADLLAEMSARQGEILAAAWEARDPEVPLASPEEALILASIVEKETAVAEERGRVAGVFANRLRDGMRLQTDPSVIYGITQGQGPLGRGLRRSELDAETPWNTYRIDGLPPTPIANPGRAAIEAAVNPSETDDLFFVADGTGGHVFAATLEEHNANVARWREIEAERGEDAPG